MLKRDKQHKILQQQIASFLIMTSILLFSFPTIYVLDVIRLFSFFLSKVVTRNDEQQNHLINFTFIITAKIKNTADEATVVPKLKQRITTGKGCYRSRLNFSLVTFFYEGKESDKCLREIKGIKYNNSRLLRSNCTIFGTFKETQE